jgi:glycosyltransferase involved in cell wall biosynthesis
MSDPIAVSIVMAMRDSAMTIGDAVRSLQLQTLREWELILIDDGSRDGSAGIVSALKDSRIRLVREETSAGLAYRLNQAIALGRGKFIARMDADDICFPSRLETQLAAMQCNPALDLIACGAVVFDETRDLVGLLPVHADHAVITRRPFDGFPMPHPTWFGRADWFRANPYDAGMRMAEDQDLLMRSHGHSRFSAVNEVLFAYRQPQLSLKKLWSGRRTFIGAAWRHGRRSGRYLPAVSTTTIHLTKAAVDVTTLSLGLNRRMQRQRLQPVPPVLAANWKALQARLQEPVEEAV